MKALSKLFSLPVIVLLAWMGANIYQDNDLFANPFVKQSFIDKLENRATDDIADDITNGIKGVAGKAKDSLKEGVEGISESIKDAADDF